ncbi:MAG: helix-turn-helix domain-containing protein [Gammaproteobacteria bacterium]
MAEVQAAVWLDIDWLLGQFGSERSQAIAGYRQFVLAGLGNPSPLDQIQHQVLLGDDAFVARCQDEQRGERLREVSKAHRRSVALSFTAYRERYPERAEAMARAYLSGAYTMAEIGAHFGVHYMTVSRAVKRFEQHKGDD